MATLLEIKELFEAMPGDNATLEFKVEEEWGNTFTYPGITSKIENWRWKPGSKIVNLAALVGTGIDCEFWDNKDYPIIIGSLIAINNDNTYAYSTTTMTGFLYCRPRYNRWFSRRDICFPDYASIAEGLNAMGFEFKKNLENTMFRITGLQEGWQYPWENKENGDTTRD